MTTQKNSLGLLALLALFVVVHKKKSKVIVEDPTGGEFIDTMTAAEKRSELIKSGFQVQALTDKEIALVYDYRYNVQIGNWKMADQLWNGAVKAIATKYNISL